MKMKKTYFLLLTVLVLIFAFTLGVCAEMSVGAYMTGYPDGSFLPDNNMTRAEAVTLIYRLIDEQEKNGEYSCTFTDVKKDDWYYEYVAYFQSKKYLEDYKKEFEPNKAITRAEFVALLLNLREYDNHTYIPFTDVKRGDKYFDQILVAASNGLVSGYPDGSFRPDGNITRAEVVTVVNRFLSRKAAGGKFTKTFTDIDSHWAKEQILLSANESDGGKVWIEDEPKYVSPFTDTQSTYEKIDTLIENYRSIKTDDYLKAVDELTESRIDEIINTPNTITAPTGTVYYVSNKGNDANDGRTPETAWATLTKVNSMTSDATILFERGGVWRGNLVLGSKCTISAYGSGEKPRIYGSLKNYADPELWELTERENVYKLKEKIYNVGIIALDHSHIIGDTVGKTAGKFMIAVTQLNHDDCYYSDLDTGDLYYYSSKGNPGEIYESIEIGTNEHIIRAANSGNTIDNLCLMYTGAHGIKGNSSISLTVTNCVIGWVGGSELNKGTQYGNAIEIYGSCSGFHMINNYTYQCYDTGLTIQSSNDGVCKQMDVVMKGNVVNKCFWGLEFYNTGADPQNKKICRDFDICYNIVANTAYGWGRAGSGSAYQSCGMTKNVENFKVYKNIFDTAEFSSAILSLRAGGDEFIEFSDNVYINMFDRNFGSYPKKSLMFSHTLYDKLTDPESMAQINPILVFKKETFDF